MRKGLIKLLKEVNGKFNDMYDGLDCEGAADFLIDNGVTAPPCAVDEDEADVCDCVNRPPKPPSPISKLWAAKIGEGIGDRLTLYGGTFAKESNGQVVKIVGGPVEREVDDGIS